LPGTTIVSLKLARARALTDVAADGHHVELLILNERLDRVDLQRHGGPAEMQIADVQNTGQDLQLLTAWQ
jgi:hypothetical protein